MGAAKAIEPQPGPQTAFLSTSADIAIYGGSAGGGKALDVNTQIPTPSGWVLMRDLKANDFVLGDDGDPCRVISATDIMYNHDCYRVTFGNGAYIDADADHLWVTYSLADKSALTHRTDEYRSKRRATRPKRGTGKRNDLAEANSNRVAQYKSAPTGSIVTTRQMLDRLRCNGRSNQFVKICPIVELPDAALPISPYVLGVWLGDGTSRSANITTADVEVLRNITDCGYGNRKTPSAKYDYYIEGLHADLKESNLLNNKHIPHAYIWASATQRLELVRGLMDTDGTVRPNGVCNFDNKNYSIIEGLHTLLASLGIKSRISPRKARLNGMDCGTTYRLAFTTNKTVFKLQRKLERLVDTERGVQDWHIVKSIEPIESMPVKCIAVDNESHMYLAGKSMIPTHNTWSILVEPLRHVGNKGFSSLTFRRNGTQVRNPGGLWDKSTELYPLPGARPIQQPMEWIFPSGAKVKFAHLEHEQSKLDWQGAEIPLIQFDELTHFSESQFFYMLSRNRSMCGVKPYIRATCNPDADSWVADFIAWWIDQDTGLPILERSGVIRWMIRVNDKVVWADTREELIETHGEDCMPKSVTFIAASLFDNKILMEADPGYLANLKALSRVERERLLGGNWKIRPAAGLYFRREWVKVVDAAPAGLRMVRYWDLAATEKTDSNDPDFTANVKMGRTQDGHIYIMHGASMQESPYRVEQAIKNHAEIDGRQVIVGLPQDPGQAGKSQAQGFVKMLPSHTVRTRRESGDKVTRFGPFSAQCEAGNVFFVRGPWNNEFFDALEGFPEAKHDDHADACSGAYNLLLESSGGFVRVY